MRFAGDHGNFLEAEHEADARQGRRRQAEKTVIEPAAATEPETFRVESHPRHEDAIEFRQRDAGATERIRLAQAERARHNDVIPTRDLMPVEFGRGAVLDHQRQDDALALRPGFLDERVDVRLRGEGREERDTE